MALDLDKARTTEPELGPDFLARVDTALSQADRERRRHLQFTRLSRALPLVLLIGPIVGWRLMLASPDGVHIGINALAWVTFVLDVGVHLDSSLLEYLGLQILPSLVGVLLLVLVTATLLTGENDRS